MKPIRITGCRHRKSWIIGGGRYEWCYECGSFRELEDLSENCSIPFSPWVKPTGAGGENPYSKWVKDKDAWDKKRNRK